MGVWGVVVAGGRASRFGRPKQFERLGDARVVDRAVMMTAAACDGVVVVLPAGVRWDGYKAVTAVAGGERRSDSVRAGLAAVPADAEVIVVHDAARPLADVGIFTAVIDAVRGGADAAVPVVPVVDTLKRIQDGQVLDTVPRQQVVSAQTPQAFRAAVLRAAHAAGGDATDDAALVEAAGGMVRAVLGDPRNLKVTTVHDLDVAEALLDAWRASSQ